MVIAGKTVVCPLFSCWKMAASCCRVGLSFLTERDAADGRFRIHLNRACEENNMNAKRLAPEKRGLSPVCSPCRRCPAVKRFVVGWGSLVVRSFVALLLLCGTGSGFAATTINSATLDGGTYSAVSPYYVSPGQVITAVLNVYYSGSGNWKSSGAGFGTVLPSWVLGTNCANNSSGVVPAFAGAEGTYIQTFTTTVQATPTGTLNAYFNTYTNSSCGGGGDALIWANAIVTRITAPTVAKSFSPSTIGVNATSVLTITLANANTTAITGAAFTDTYPAGLVNTASPSGATTCTGGTVTAANGGGSVALSGGTIPASGSCTVTVNVTSASAGSYDNSTGAVTTTNAVSGTAASATLTVILNPTVAKSFSPSTIGVNATSVLTITLTNANTTAITGAAFTDTYPAGLVNTASPSGATTCTGGTVTAANGGGSVALSGGTIPASGSCTVTVNVTSASAGSYVNSTGAVTTTNAGSGTAASATLTVAVLVSNFNAFESTTAAGAIDGVIYTKIAGTAFSLDVVAISGDAQASSFNSDVKVELVANDGTSCLTSSSVIQTITPAAISSGRSIVNFAAVSYAYRDVRMRISYPTSSPTIIVCSSDNFAIRPTSFTGLSSTNANNTGSTGTPFLKTGANFNLTVNSVAGYNGTPSTDNTKVVGSPTAGTIGGSFGAAPVGTGTATGASFFYSEVGNFGLSLNAIYDSSFTSVDQVNDCTADFSNTLVGGKYGCSFGSPAIVLASGFGRFTPDNFSVSLNAPTFGTTCGTFGYVGQAFTYNTAPVITVTARNGTNNTPANATTTNYAESYMKFSNSVGVSLNQAPYSTQGGRYSRFDALGGGITPTLDTAVLPATTADPTIGTFTSGVGTLTFGSGSGLGFTRSTTTPSAPFNADIALAINVIDSDGVAASNPVSFGAASVGNGIAFSDGNALTTNDKEMRFGRLVIGTGFGSELLPVPVPMRTEYFDGTSFITNTDDNCTALSLADHLRLSNLDTAGGDVQAGDATMDIAPGNNNTSITVFNSPLISGNAAARFSAPGSGNVGFVNIAGNLNCLEPTIACVGPNTFPHLLYDWADVDGLGDGPYDGNPTGRVDFGVYEGPRTHIYTREPW